MENKTISNTPASTNSLINKSSQSYQFKTFIPKIYTINEYNENSYNIPNTLFDSNSSLIRVLESYHTPTLHPYNFIGPIQPTPTDMINDASETNFKTIANKFGVYCREFDASQENIISNLKAGKKIILKVNNSKDSNNDSYLILSEITSDNKIIIERNVPNLVNSDNTFYNTNGSSNFQLLVDIDYVTNNFSTENSSAWLFMPDDNLIKKEDITTYYQYNYPQKYGHSGTISSSGCGAVSAAITISTLLGESVSPVETANWLFQHGFRIPNGGTDFHGIDDVVEAYGLTCHQVQPTKEAIYQELEAGNQIIVNVGPGNFTRSGHYMVLCGIDKTGNIILCDPNSEVKSSQVWPVEVFINQRQKFPETTSFYSCSKA